MNSLVFIAIGGALGSLARHGLNVWFESLFGNDFPYSIFVANVLGSLAIGVCFVLLVEREQLPEIWRGLAMVGFLGDAEGERGTGESDGTEGEVEPSLPSAAAGRGVASWVAGLGCCQ